MNKRGNLQNVGYPVFFTPSAIAKLSFICDGEVTFKFFLLLCFNAEALFFNLWYCHAAPPFFLFMLPLAMH